MSNRYKGGVISATPPTTTGGEDGTASGAWTLEQQMQLQAAGLWPAQPTGPYIEQVFSTYLYTGNGSTQTITNGIDLSGKGGLVWFKRRNTDAFHQLYDTARGIQQTIYTNATNAQVSKPVGLTAFNANGFTVGSEAGVNGSGDSQVSWSFAKAPKFFDVVTWSGNGTIGRTISHSLGSVPGCIIVKRTNGVGDWVVYHRSLGATKAMLLNLTDSVYTWNVWNDTAPTSTVFSLNDASEVNGAGNTYVAYVLAHDAGGFGLTGTDNVISCGSFSGNTTVTLGYEPQWIMLKRTDAVGNWDMHDVMRGWPVSGDAARLRANLSDAESQTSQIYPNATGFSTLIGAGNYIYIAIRRGPMRVPTSGTSVFEPKTMTATQANLSITGVGFPPDLVINGVRSNANYGQQVTDRLRGVTKQVFTEYDSAENTTNGTAVVSLNMNGISLGADTGGTGWNAYSGYTSVKWMFGRAPSFFDEVCYTGTGSNTTQTHNLGVAPELVIIKSRSNAIVWVVGNTTIGFANYLLLNATDASASGSNVFNSTAPTSTVFSIGTGSGTNQSGATYVAYLFATLAGVSKVGSYTGTATTKQVDCGFAAGARFVLIKRTDSTGDWYVWDSARGISSGNDPYLLLNSAAAEVTGTNYVDTTAVGFQVTAAAPAGLNANGGTFIFLAIA